MCRGEGGREGGGDASEGRKAQKKRGKQKRRNRTRTRKTARKKKGFNMSARIKKKNTTHVKRRGGRRQENATTITDIYCSAERSRENDNKEQENERGVIHAAECV